jgi:hypothetical protein
MTRVPRRVPHGARMTGRTFRATLTGLSVVVVLVCVSAPSSAARVRTPETPAPSDSAHGRPAARASPDAMPGMDMSGTPHDHASTMAGMDHAEHGTMRGALGEYPMSREASGTSWQPEGVPHRGLHEMRGDWTLMLHGNADLIGDAQGGPRGDDRVFGANMLMAMARRPLAGGWLGLRAMTSLDPATIGTRGYPLLLQTGETADGVTPLIDRQHPHDLFMELAASWSVSAGDASAFLYLGLPGEPALGPAAYMHRSSGEDVPETPITHHWLDSTHITYGVVTLGAIRGALKVEGSAFRGREPDERRWNLESPKLDSYAGRVTFNPTPAWSMQISGGRLESPEALEPGVDQARVTASIAHQSTDARGGWGSLLAVARARNRPGHTLDAALFESTRHLGQHSAFARLESVEKDELFEGSDPLAGHVFHVAKLGAGYAIELWRATHASFALGAYGSVSRVPPSLRSAYGETPLGGMLFARARLR